MILGVAFLALITVYDSKNILIAIGVILLVFGAFCFIILVVISFRK